MITIEELLSGNVLEMLPKAHQENLITLLHRINLVREAWGYPMTVTSGYRSMEHHIAIYQRLAEQRGHPFDMSQVPMGSQHLSGAAVDISDPDGELFQWTVDNKHLMEQFELWMEQKDDQPRTHFQIYPPKSGNRWFKP